MGRSPSNQMLATQTKSIHADEQSKQVFLLFYSPDKDKKDIAEAVHALYYLPENYELVILGGTFTGDRDMMPWADKSITSRIHFENRTGLSEEEKTSPFLYISDGEAKKSVFEQALTAPQVVISEAGDEAEPDNASQVTVSNDNPEALASAILRIARLQYAF